MSKGNVLEEMKTSTPLGPATSVPQHLLRAAFSAGVGSYYSICTLTAPTDTNTYFPGCVYIETTNGRICCNAASSVTAAAVMSSQFS